MPGVLAALLVGIMIGLFVRPFLDAYVAWRSARFYADADEQGSSQRDELGYRSPLS